VLPWSVSAGQHSDKNFFDQVFFDQDSSDLRNAQVTLTVGVAAFFSAKREGR
jgi:hypothetical protein